MKDEILLDPVTVQRAPEAIYEQIRGKILNGEFKPGDKIPSERAMMEMLGLSRPTIREAMRMLEQSGLIETNQGSGRTIVKEPSVASLEKPLESMLALSAVSFSEMLEFRRINEIAIVELACKNRSDEDLLAMENCLAEVDDVFSDIQRFIDVDIRFHQLIADASNNRLISLVQNMLHQLVSRHVTIFFEALPGQERDVIETFIFDTHRAVFLAIAAQDKAAARSAMDHHLSFQSDILYKNEI